jgi:NNP family nitrate/nitrite transporter-like MFS transporter
LIPVALREWGLGGSYLAWLLFLMVGTVTYAFLGRNAPYFQLRSQGFNRVESRERASEMGQELFPAWSVRESLRISAGAWQTWALVFVYFTSFGGFIGLTAWLPLYWQRFMAVGVVAAGGLTALYSISASLIRVAGGHISDRMGGHATAVLGLGLTLLGSVLLVISSQFAAAVLAVMLLALGMGVANAAVFKLVPQAVPRAVGGVAGWVGGLGAFGGFVIPPLMATFVEMWGPRGYSLGFGLFIILSLFALGMVLLLKRFAVPSSTAAPVSQTVTESTTI